MSRMWPQSPLAFLASASCVTLQPFPLVTEASSLAFSIIGAFGQNLSTPEATRKNGCGRHMWDTDGRACKGYPNGHFRKLDSILECQSRIAQPPALPRPVCWRKRQYDSREHAENAMCFLLGIGEVQEHERGKIISGPCQQPGRTKLHGFARRWIRRMAKLRAPGVPSAFLWLQDVETETKWYFQDWFTKATPIEKVKGDGTITALAVQAPCEQFRAEQEGVSVDCVPLDYAAKVDHQTVLNHAPFLELFTRLVISSSRTDFAELVLQASSHAGAGHALVLPRGDLDAGSSDDERPRCFLGRCCCKSRRARSRSPASASSTAVSA